MRRMKILLLTLLFCFLACAVGGFMLVQFDAIAPCIICAAIFPAAGAFWGGVRDRAALAKIACYAVLGWGLGYLLQPQVAGIKSKMNWSLTEVWAVIAFVPATLLALTGAFFAPSSDASEAAVQDS